MTKMAKPFVWGKSLAVAVILASACGRPPEDLTGPVEIDFWNGFSGPDGDAMKALVTSFNESQKDVRVKMQIIPWGTYYDKVTLGLAFGDAPELFVLHAHRIPEFADHGALAPMGAFMKRSGLGQTDFAERSWQAGLWKDERYGLPLDCHPFGLYYNKTMFREAGIAAPPTTYDEFVTAGRKLTKKGQWGFVFSNLPVMGLTFLDQWGAEILTPDGTKSALRSPEAVAALTAMTGIVTKERIAPPPAGTDAWLSFQTGKAAMCIEGVWMMTSLEKGSEIEWAAAPVPRFGPKQAVWAGSHSLAIPAKASPRRRAAAWRFAQYLSKNSLGWAKGGQVPARLSVLESAGFRALPTQSAFARQLPYVVFEPRHTMMNGVSPFLASAVESAMNGLETPAKALDTAARRIDEVLVR